MVDNIYDVVVIGAGAGGMTVANYAGRAGLNVALIERGLYGGQLNNTDEIENYTGFSSVTGVELAEQMEAQSRVQENVSHIYGNVMNVVKVDDKFIIKLRKRFIVAKTVVIATGVKHKNLNVVGEEEYEGKGVSYCAVCDANFYKDKHVAVIGGGNSAVESALYLSNIVERVTLLHRRDELRADNILQNKMFETGNIEVIWNTQTEAIKGIDGKMAGLTYQDKADGSKIFLGAEGAFVNIGVEPVTGFIDNSLRVTDENGFIITNSKMETSVDGLYAIGDVRADSVRQIVSATGDGAIASNKITEYLRGLD